MGSGSSPGGGTTHPGGLRDLGGGAPSRWGQPNAVLRKRERKTKRREKKGKVGKKRRTPPSNPSWTRIGGGLLLPLVAQPLGLLEPQGKPPLPSSYIYGAIRADLRQLCHGSPTTKHHGFSSRSYFCGARAEPCRSRSFTTTGAPSRCRRTHLLLRLACWIKKAEIIIELYVC